MTKRRVIFPPADFWTDPPKENPMSQRLTNQQLDAALAALAMVDAQLDHDQIAVDALIEPWTTDIAPVMQYLFWLCSRQFEVYTPDAHQAVDQLRASILREIADQ